MKKKAIKVTAEIKKLFNNDGNVKAVVSLTIEEAFVVRGVRLVDGKNGLFVSMPSRRNAAKEFYDICFPINNDMRLHIFDAVKAAYDKALLSIESTEVAEDSEQETA